MANIYEPSRTAYSSGQRAVSLTLGVACSIPLTATMAMANGQMPMPASAWQAHVPLTAGFHSTAPNSVHHAVTSLVRGGPLSIHAPMAPNGVLNLASSSLSYLAGNLANFGSLTIDVGGKQEQVGLNTKLTAAEVVAVEQVITGGSGASQTIKIGSNGVADGGSVSLNNNLLSALDNSVGGSISSLTIAKGVQVVDSLNALTLSGRLANYGSILTAAGSAGSSDTITAGTILNASGGAIGSYGGGGGLVGADPNLVAGTSFTNNGSISSAGNLTISAPVVYNVASHGSAATINAAQNVNINTQNLNNSGLIAAVTGNVNVASTAGINLAGTGGTLQANSGNINLSSANADIDVNGGNMLSQQVNFNAGTGNINGQMDQVTGVVSASGNNVHLGGNTATLNLGAITATDDPTITNTGNLSISDLIAATGGGAAGNLTLVAGGNITVAASSKVGLDTSQTTGTSGGQINLIAGAAFTTTPTGAGNQTASGNTTVTKASTTGGIIDLTGGNGGGGPIAKITSTGTSGAGGNIEMVAFAGKTLGSGSVITPAGITIDASSLTGTAGTVTIIGGAKSGVAVTTGGIKGGTITVDASTPVITPAKGGKGVVFDSTGLESAGTFGVGKTGNVASIALGNVNTTGTLNINTGSGASVANSTSGLNLGTITLGKTGAFAASDSDPGANNINIGGIITGGSTTLTETGGGLITQSGTGSVNTTSLLLNAGNAKGTNIFNTDVATLTLLSAGSNVQVTQGALTTSLSGSIGGAGTLAITSGGQINVTALTKVGGTALTLTTTAASKGGISIAAPIQVGATGTITLSNNGKGLLTETAGNVLTAPNVTLISDTSFGSKTVGFATNTSTLDVQDTGTKNIAYVSDQNTGALTFQDSNALAGGSLFLTSVAAKGLDISSANYNNVSITNNVLQANGVDFGTAAAILGTGLGTFTVVSASPITDSLGSTIKGTTVSLTGLGSKATNGVGLNGQNIIVTSANLVLNSSTGSVFVFDNAAATVNGSASLNGKAFFSVTDNGQGTLKIPASLTVGKSVAGGNIDLKTGGVTPGTIAVTGTLGTVNTTSVTLTSAAGLTTKGAINGATIDATATGPLTIGGAVGGLGSVLDLTTVGAAKITIGGVLSGNSITVGTVTGGSGMVTTTKAITATGPGSMVNIYGDGTSDIDHRAIVIGGAISGLTLNLKLDNGASGSIVVNANVGGVTTNATTIDVSNGGVGAAITGKGVIGGLTVELDAAGGIGTAKAPILTAAVNLNLNTTKANIGGTFISQKGNLSIGTVNTDNFVIKVTGTTDVVGPIIVPALSLTSTLATVIGGSITITAGGTTPNIITSGGALTTNALSSIDATASTQPLTVNVTGVGTINGTVGAQTLNLTTSGALTIGTTGEVGNKVAGNYNVTSKGAINVSGALGDATGLDVLKVSTTGAFTLGFPSLAATLDGAATSTIAGLTIANYGTADGSIAYTATGAGNAFSNFGTVGNAAGLDVIAINAAKGSIFSSAASVINEGSLSLISGVNATVNLGGSGATPTTLTGATVKGALDVNFTNGDLVIGSAAVGSVTAGSVTVQVVNPAPATNNNTLTLNSIAATTGNLTVSSNARNLAVGAAASLTTVAGNITLQNTSTNAAAVIAIGNTVTIHGSGAKTNLNQGNVSIFLGAAGFTPITGTGPVGATVTGPVTFASVQNPVSTILAGTAVTLNSSGRNLAFNTAVGSITIGNTVAITADPPAGSTISLAPSSSSVNTLTVPAAAFAAAPGAFSSTVLLAPSSVNAASPGSLIASVNGPTVAVMTVVNPGLSAGFLSSIGSIATDQNTIESAIGSSSNSSSVGRTSGIAGLRPLTGGVSNTAHRSLDRGPLLLSPEQNTVVETPFGSVRVAANSVALIISSDDGLAVYDLHDGRKNAVVISNGSDTVALTPGRSAVLTRSSVNSFEEVNPAPIVGYRQVASKAMGSDGKLYQAEFEILSMVRGLPQIGHLISSDSARTRKTMSNMLKTAAILMQISQGGEAYNLYLSPAKTAFLSSAQR